MSTQQLYQGLIEDGHYTKSIQEFQVQFQTKDKQLELYNGIVGDGDFTGSFIEFQNKFFPTQAATTTTTPTSTSTSTSKSKSKSKSKTEKKEEPTFVNTEFWENQKYARENYTYRDGKWYYKNPKSGKEVEISKTHKGKTSASSTIQRLEELQKEREAELNYKRSKLELEKDLLNNKEEKTDEDIQKELEIDNQINSIGTETSIDEEEKNKQKKEQGFLKMPEVTKDITEKDDEDAVEELNRKYGEYGFTFRVDEDGTDQVFVTSNYDENGKFVPGGVTKIFKFDQGAIFDDDKKNSDEAKRMNDWMRDRAVKQSSAKTLQGVFAKTETKEEVKQKTVKNLNYYNQVRDAFSNYEVTPRTDSDYYREEAELIESTLGQLSEMSDEELESWINRKISSSGSRLAKLSAMDSHNFGQEEAMLEKIHDILVESGLSGKGFYSKPEVIKETDQAVKNGILGTAISRWERETGLEFDEKNPEHNSAVFDLQESIKREWEELRDSDDEEAMLESDIYNNILNAATNVTESFNIRKNIRDYAEDQDGNVFMKGASQKLSAEKAEEEFDKLKQESKNLLNEQSAIEEVITVSDKKLKETLKWFEDNDIDAQIKEIRSKKYNTQEEVDAANEKINSLTNGFNSKLQEYNNAKFSLEQAVITAKTLQRDFTEIIENREDFKEISKYLNQNYQWGTLTIKSLGDAGADLLQGIATAAEVIYNLPGIVARDSSRALLDYAALNPDSSVGKFVNSPVINSGLHGTEAVGDFYTNDRFDDNPKTRSLPQRLHDAIDDFQESNIMNVADPTAFGEIDGWGDFGKWTSSMLASQAPQLALLIASGGSSMLTQTALLTASAGGQKFLGYEEERDLYLESGGLYGKNYSFGNMILSSTAVGLAEALSERITYGQIKGVSAGLKRANLELLEQQVKGTFKRGFSREYVRGYFQHMGKTVLNPKLMAYAGYQRFEEGVSESVATISENLIGLANGEDISVWDNVDQAFVSGVIMSQAISSPVLFNQMSAPFRAANTQGILNSNTTRMEKLLQELHSSDNLDPVREQEIIEEYKNLKEESMKVMELDVKRVDAMNEFEKGKLLEIHKSQKKAIKEATSLQTQLNNGEITQEQFDQKYKELNNQYSNRDNQKQKILDKYDVNVIDVTYKQTLNSMRDKAKEINNASEGSINIDIQEGNDGDLVQWQIENEGYTVDESDADGNPTRIIMKENNRKGKIKEFKNQLNDPNLTAKERSAVESNLKVLESGVDVGMDINQYNEIMNNSSNYGSFVPQYDSDGNYTGQKIFINKNASHDGGEFSIASHEFMHGLLYSTLKGDMRTQNALTETILETLKQEGVKIPDAVMSKINSYAQDGTKGEEIMTVLSQAISDGDIKLPKTALGGFKNFYRRYGYNHHGVAIEFDTDQDIINFLKDYTYSMKNNKQNKALTNMFIHGASGDLIQKQQRYRDLRKKYRDNAGERAKQAMFSKNIDQEIRNNPDLLTEIDAFVKNEDGSPKYTDKDTWQNSVDFTDAYMYITQKKSLDGLIQAGMVGEGVNTPQALGEFTRKVKDELGERLFKNFDPAKNDSLFGWLTGVSGGMGKSIIYRAKGDVMVEYSKQIKAVSLDKGMTTEGGDTFSSQIEGETDTEMERLESEDLTIGKTTVKKSDVDIVFLESVNADPSVRKEINKINKEAGDTLDGLTYKGTKTNITAHKKFTKEGVEITPELKKKYKAQGKKAPKELKTKRKPTGPLYGALQIISEFYGVDPIRIIQEQDLNDTQRNLAREYLTEHMQQHIDMFPEGENRSGDATGAANTVMGKYFYITGDRISMAESGTGKGKKSQTLRTDITVQEVIDLINQPGTKSDGLIRQLILHAAVISANQTHRLEKLKELEAKKATLTDPQYRTEIAKIVVVGDGKNAIMFSKRKEQTLQIPFQKIGSIDRNLSLAGKDNFWTNINAFANENILDRNLDSIKIGLENAYAPFPEILENVDQIAKSIHDVVQGMKDPIVKNPIKLSEALVTSNENQLVKVQESSGSNINAAEAFRQTARVKGYVATTTVLTNQMFNPSDPGLSIAKIMMMKGHLASMGKNSYLKRKQIFPGTKEFLANTLGKIKGIEYTTKKSKDGKVSLNKVTYNGQSIVVPSILSSQSSGAALSDTKSETKMNSRGINEDIAQESLNDIVTFYSDLFKKGEIDNVDLMMVQASLLSGMNSVLARAAKLKYISENAFDFKNPGKQVRYEHMLPRVSIVINMFNSHINGDGISNIKDYLKNYTVQIIPNSMDKAISDAKLGSSLLEGQTLQDPAWVRNYNSRTEGDKRLVALKDVFTNEVLIPSKAFVLTNNILNKNRKNTISFSKAVNQANTTNENTPSRGMSAFDFDETLIDKGDNTIIATKTIDKKVTKASLESFSDAELVKLADALKDPEYLRPLQNVANEFYFESANRNDLMNAIIKHLGTNYGKPKTLREMTEAQVVKIAELMKDPEYFRPVQNKLNEFYFESANLNDLIKAIEVQRKKKYSEGINKILDIAIGIKEEQKISSSNWPLQGPQLAADGYDFDFSDFVNVKGGVEGPLMQKFRNRITKYGIENNYILTARPAEAAPAIQAWLKQQGIDMPIENITGLGNSTGEAKAMWMVEKFAEGYNDMYFVDDALPNVKAVKDVMNQLDIKGSSVQAKIQFSKRIKSEFSNIINNAAQQEIGLDFNRILEQTKGVKAESRFSDAQAKVRGSKKGKYAFFVPPSAEDFKGLLYRFLSKGKVGEQQMAFFKKALFDPFGRATTTINVQKQKTQNEYRQLLKQFPEVKKDLNTKLDDYTGFEGNNFSVEQAIRVYLWDKAGFEVPGLSARDLKALKDFVNKDSDLLAFADSLGIITNQDNGYLQPGEFWLVENIQSDLNQVTNEISRDQHLQEFKQNREKIFGEWKGNQLVGANMNKIEAIYGTRFREALEDILYRMEYGRKREAGSNRLVNTFNNWANQSVGAIMFFNMRSALLQTISSVNYLNWSDNNPLKAGAALANFPQFLKDFSMIFNSDMLKQRRAGNQRGINEAELANAVGGVGIANRVKAMLNWLLTKGFLPTQIADSFAIASGGATFYRNRVNSYIKQGYSQTESQTKAFQDFQEITEESQQSSRPDMISQQQASPLGRYILAFKNTPMQYARLMKKSYLDLVNGRGDYKTNVGKIIYYGGVQNLIFNGLQAALGALIGDDEEDKEKTNQQMRIANSMIDSILGGIGFGGNAVMTIKNAILEYNKQNNKKWNSDHTYTILKLVGFSPTVGSKLRKIYSSIQTEKFNKDVISEMSMLDIDNPRWSAIANLVSGLTNIPLDRLVKKMDNIDAALTEDISNMERFALLMGWNTWDLGIEDQDVIAVENEIKEKKQIEKKEKQKIKKEEKEIKVKEENKLKEEENKKKKDDICIAISKSGKRCKKKAESGGYCTVHAKVEQGTKEVQCSKIKSDKTRCKMKTKAKSGLCYYHD